MSDIICRRVCRWHHIWGAKRNGNISILAHDSRRSINCIRTYGARAAFHGKMFNGHLTDSVLIPYGTRAWKGDPKLCWREQSSLPSEPLDAFTTWPASTAWPSSSGGCIRKSTSVRSCLSLALPTWSFEPFIFLHQRFMDAALRARPLANKRAESLRVQGRCSKGPF